jgi:hypothetical protein
MCGHTGAFSHIRQLEWFYLPLTAAIKQHTVQAFPRTPLKEFRESGGQDLLHFEFKLSSFYRVSNTNKLQLTS